MKKYRYEYQMCDDFIEKNKDHFDIYPECYGYDMLLFSKIDEVQIGVQAKLKNNLQVIYQILDNTENMNLKLKRIGPHYRAILSPEIDGRYRMLCRRLGIAHFNPYDAIMIDIPDFGWRIKPFYESPLQPHIQRHTRPELKLNDSPGKSSPKNLSTWRVAAIKAMVIYYKQSYITSSQLRELGINPSSFDQWFYLSKEKIGRCRKMVLKEDGYTPIIGYEKEFTQLKERSK